MSKYNELVKKLKEIFQIDRPELDFGIYRILNARAGNDSNLLIVFYVQIMPDDFVMQLHRF